MPRGAGPVRRLDELAMSDDRSNQKLRVLTMVDGLHGGGEKIAWQIAQRLDRDRFVPMVCVTRWRRDPDNDRVRGELEDDGVEFIGMSRKSRLDVGPWRKLIAEMRRRRIDVLHTHKIGSNIWGAVLTPIVPIPVFVAHEHTWSWEGNARRKLLDRYLISHRAGAFVAVSAADRQRMTSIEGIPRSKTRFIPNGIPDPAPSRSMASMRSELGLVGDEPVIGMVAVLRRQKAYDVLIRSAALVRKEFPRLRVLIVGGDDTGGELGAELEDLVRELDLESTVTFLGMRQDAYDVMSVFDVAVLSSDYEGSPIVVMEYMDAGLPVVATRVGGVADLVDDGVTGVLVEPRRPDAIAGAVVELLRDSDRAKKMGAAGRVRRRQEFSIDNTTRKVEDLYEELYAARGR
jgi:glycosyltransferase involved in cell wall biosynthesis